MSNFILNNTAEEVNSAIGKVVNATTSPLDESPNMVTSGGVKAYVDTQIGALDPRLTAAESDITALQNAPARVATYSRTANTAYTGTSIIQLTEVSDPDNIGTPISSGGVRVGAGIYLVNLVGEFFEDDGDYNDYFKVNLRDSGTVVFSAGINEMGSGYKLVNAVYISTVPASSTKDLDIQFQEVSNTVGYSKNVVLTLVKLA